MPPGYVLRLWLVCARAHTHIGTRVAVADIVIACKTSCYHEVMFSPKFDRGGSLEPTESSIRLSFGLGTISKRDQQYPFYAFKRSAFGRSPPTHK